MVTVDEKLAFFAKVLEQHNNETMQEEIHTMEQYYQEKLQDVRQTVAIEARAIVADYTKRAERERLAKQSKARLYTKKSNTWIKEKYVEQFMDALVKRFEVFRETEAYWLYMKGLLEKMPSVAHQHPIHIVLTPEDYKVFEQPIKEVLREQGVVIEQLVIEKGEGSWLGGFIWLDPIDAIRIDCSVQTRFKAHKEWVAGIIFRALTEGGD